MPRFRQQGLVKAVKLQVVREVDGATVEIDVDHVEKFATLTDEKEQLEQSNGTLLGVITF
jgi:hypothetical protein